jgi:hypothetical protein
MAYRSHYLVLVFASLTFGALPARTQAPAPTPVGTPVVADLHWLAGCWERRAGALLIEEHWLAPRAGVLLGLSRTTRNDTLAVGYEFMRIFARGDTLVLEAQPSRQAPTEFVARLQPAAREIVFENPAHDFPQRIRYQAVGTDSLRARIEGMRGGQLRWVEFPYARMACPLATPSP